MRSLKRLARPARSMPVESQHTYPRRFCTNSGKESHVPSGHVRRRRRFRTSCRVTTFFLSATQTHGRRVFSPDACLVAGGGWGGSRGRVRGLPKVEDRACVTRVWNFRDL